MYYDLSALMLGVLLQNQKMERIVDTMAEQIFLSDSLVHHRGLMLETMVLLESETLILN